MERVLGVHIRRSVHINMRDIHYFLKSYELQQEYIPEVKKHTGFRKNLEQVPLLVGLHRCAELEAGVHGGIAQLLLDPQKLVVLGKTL